MGGTASVSVQKGSAYVKKDDSGSTDAHRASQALAGTGGENGSYLLLQELAYQARKPFDASDVVHIEEARKELKRLRFLVNASNVSSCDESQLVESYNNDSDGIGGRIISSPTVIVSPEPNRTAVEKGQVKNTSLSRALANLGENFDSFRQAAESKGDMFEDQAFPASRASLCRKWNQLDADSQEKWSTFTWKRISHKSDSDSGHADAGLFVDGINPEDITQGQLGDCYLLSALSVLAEYPQRVKNIFVNKEVSPIGMYAIQFWIGGQRREVIVDDRVPFDPQTNTFAFARPGNGSEKWVPLCEKAWAKVNGDYNSVQGGDPAAMLTALTGCRSDTLYVSEDPRGTWEALLDAERKHYVMAAGTGPFATKEVGLVPNHAYAILGLFTFPTPGKPTHTTRLVQLRNPWGRLEYNGDWNDTSPLWTEDLKKLVGWSSSTNDGVFHMELVDFAKLFENVAVCRVVEDLKYAHSPLNKFVTPAATDSGGGLSRHRQPLLH